MPFATSCEAYCSSASTKPGNSCCWTMRISTSNVLSYSCAPMGSLNDRRAVLSLMLIRRHCFALSSHTVNLTACRRKLNFVTSRSSKLDFSKDCCLGSKYNILRLTKSTAVQIQNNTEGFQRKKSHFLPKRSIPFHNFSIEHPFCKTFP